MLNMHDKLDKENKFDNCRHLYCYLYKNRWFLNKHPNFNKTVQQKLYSFYKIDKWDAANEIYHYEIYGIKIN